MNECRPLSTSVQEFVLESPDGGTAVVESNQLSHTHSQGFFFVCKGWDVNGNYPRLGDISSGLESESMHRGTFKCSFIFSFIQIDYETS